MDAPCCDVFELVDGKIKRFDCYLEGSIILTQLGAIGNLSVALHDFVLLNRITGTPAPRAAITQAASNLRSALLTTTNVKGEPR